MVMHCCKGKQNQNYGELLAAYHSISNSFRECWLYFTLFLPETGNEGFPKVFGTNLLLYIGRSIYITEPK